MTTDCLNKRDTDITIFGDEYINKLVKRRTKKCGIN